MIETNNNKVKCFKKVHISQENLLPILIVIIGLLSGGCAVLFRLSIAFLDNTFFNSDIFQLPYNLHFFLIPVIISIITGILIYKFFPMSKGSGIPQVKTSIHYNYGKIPIKELFGKFMTGIMSIGGGLAVGREGPTIFICSALGSWFGKVFSIKRSNIKNVVVSGAAGGLAAAFNTPMAAVIFVIEELLGNLSTKIIGATVISCVIASSLERLLMGNHPTFIVPDYTMKQPLELVFYVILGLFCGLLAAFFVKAMVYSTVKLKNMKLIHKSILPVIGGVFIGLCAVILPNEITGFGYEPKNNYKNSEIEYEKNIKIEKVGPAEAIYKQIEDVMAKSSLTKFTILTIFFLLIYRLFAVILCYTSGAAGGIFAPTIFIGAMAGGLIGLITNSFFPVVTAEYGAYALVGMGAFFAGVMKTPITAILLIFEMTHNYKIILPIMAASMVSYSFSRIFVKQSIYDELLKLDGVHISNETVDLKEIEVAEAMTSPVETISGSLDIKEAYLLFKDKTYYSYPVLDERGNLLGLLRKYMLNKYLKAENFTIKISEIVKEKKLPFLYSDYRLDTAIKLLTSYETTVLPVLDNKKNNKVIGIITHNDIIKCYNKIKNMVENS